ncbi:MAG: DUF4340 domain-containing protein [Lentisphaerales bacterium]|nr:DUF4340 domain-containing protein [Lentisphaerales bacterium]
MRKKQFIVALVLLIVLVSVSLATRDKVNTGNFDVGDKVFEDLDIAKITKINLTKSAFKQEVLLEKKQEQWKVANRYDVTADPALIRKFLNLVNTAKAVHVVPHKEEDLPLFQLDEQLGVKVELVSGEKSKETFIFGKTHTFTEKSSGRYIYLVDKKAVVLLDSPLSYISSLPSIWLKKYLPFHEEVAAATLYSDSSIIWKTERLNSRDPFRMVLPKASEKTPQQVKQLMVYAMQLRFMDIVPADNNFQADPQLKKHNLVLQTFDGKIYNLNFLKLKGNEIRCSLKLISSPSKSEFVTSLVDAERIKDELSEWHFKVPFAFYEALFK